MSLLIVAQENREREREAMRNYEKMNINNPHLSIVQREMSYSTDLQGWKQQKITCMINISNFTPSSGDP